MVRTTITLASFETPLGTMHAGVVEEGICLLEFSEPGRLDRELKQAARLFGAEISYGFHAEIGILQEQLKEYFDGHRRAFDLKLHIRGTEFQELVWKELLKIPYGTTHTYKQQALALKMPGAIRAVGHANGMNRIAIVVPCHRVIGENGKMTGYGGGLWRKRWLLEHERKNCPSPGELFLRD